MGLEAKIWEQQKGLDVKAHEKQKTQDQRLPEQHQTWLYSTKCTTNNNTLTKWNNLNYMNRDPSKIYIYIFETNW